MRGLFTLRYETDETDVLGARVITRARLTREQVERLGRPVAFQGAAGRVFEIAVLDRSGADVTADFDCFF